MKFSEFCDSVESVEQEQQFLQYVKEEYKEMKEVKEDKNAAAVTKRIPFVGKMMFALAALADCESLAEFTESEYYPVLKDWEVTFDPVTNKFGMDVSAKQKKTAGKIVITAVAVIVALLIVLKICRRKKKTLKP